MKLIKDKLTNTTFKALDFGGPDIFQVNGTWVYGPDNYNNPSLIYGDTTITLDPAGIVIDKPKGSNEWTIIDHQNMFTCDSRLTVKSNTGQVLTGVYPFNTEGKVYKLKCAENIWVMASCGGYEIESSWSGKQSDECYRLKGTGEIIKKRTTIIFDYSRPDSIGLLLPDLYTLSETPNNFRTFNSSLSCLEESRSISIDNVGYWRSSGTGNNYIVGLSDIVNGINNKYLHLFDDLIGKLFIKSYIGSNSTDTNYIKIYGSCEGVHSYSVGSYQRIFGRMPAVYLHNRQASGTSLLELSTYERKTFIDYVYNTDMGNTSASIIGHKGTGIPDGVHPNGHFRIATTYSYSIQNDTFYG